MTEPYDLPQQDPSDDLAEARAEDREWDRWEWLMWQADQDSQNYPLGWCPDGGI